MIGRCTNPQCRATFRYFHEGRVFAIDVPTARAEQWNGIAPIARPPCVQYFWLCSDCLPYMTLEHDRASGRISIRGFENALISRGPEIKKEEPCHSEDRSANRQSACVLSFEPVRRYQDPLSVLYGSPAKRANETTRA